ncbi:hypothetical protein B0O99DRAFT_609451 [Bisporella sp. PMI_857]|nr:hypothetical protein B0O99DRAFT_609451 [Bisporella sp. PMI_857]
MAKGARASTKKANNARLKSTVFGPVETARAERLNAKLMELIAQPKPSQKDVEMTAQDDVTNVEAAPASDNKQTDAMEVDQDASKSATKSKRSGRVEKRRSSSRKASIVFPKYKSSKKAGKSKK